MKKSKLNLVIDTLLLLCIAAIGGMGFLIKYVLVPGSQRWEIYKRNVDLLFWGMGRHEWGTIHLVIGYVFLALLVLHIILHWGMIVGMYRMLIPNRFARRVIAVIIILLTILLLIFPFLVQPEVLERGFEKGRGWQLLEP